MYLRRDYLIKKQLAKNKRIKSVPLSHDTLKRLEAKAHDQLNMNKIKSREMQYHQIELFLLIAEEKQKQHFYGKLKSDLRNIFSDEKAKKHFEEKWNYWLKSNVMGLFNKIAKMFYEGEAHEHFLRLYTETILKLMYEDKLSRIEEKFLDCFLIETMRRGEKLEVLGSQNYGEIYKATQKVQQIMMKKQIPKSLSNEQFLQYSIISILKMDLPHEKYLHNQLVQAPNPKFLLPFKKKGTFVSLTNQILQKLNKIDMVGFQYWNYYSYQECDVYSKIRKAAGWQSKVDTMLLIIKSKMKNGLEKYMNLINEKIKSYSNRVIDESGINQITSYTEICLEICYRKSKSEQNFAIALEKVDLGQAFQQKNFEDEPRLKDCMLKIVELYLLLLTFCGKRNLRMKFIQKLAVVIYRLIKNYNEEKFKNDLIQLVNKISNDFQKEQKLELLFFSIDYVNREWEKNQEHSNIEIIKINPYVVSFIADMAFHFGFEDYGRPDFKVLKLQFFYIMALNFKENEYFESKKKLSLASVDINHSLTNNNIFNILEIRKILHDGVRAHLKSIYGDYQFEKIENEGLLAVIDQIVSYRIQIGKDQVLEHETESFYALLINFLEQAQRADPTGKLLEIVKNYFVKCMRTYMLEMNQLKFQDEGKKKAKKLINQDVAYVIEGTVSANPIVSEFCAKILFQYIDRFPQLAFYPKILIVLAECISVLYRKSTQQYESKAQPIKGKHLITNILIPTKNKQIQKRMIKIMTAMYMIILHGHCINDNYLRIRTNYLIKENCNTSDLTFGWKYLKHLITNFKQDKEYIAKEVLMNNSCAWFINEEFFNKKIKQMKPERILLNKYLLPIHKNECDINDLKKIFLSVQPEMETDFLIVPLKETETDVEEIIDNLELTCQKIQNLKDIHPHSSEIIEPYQKNLYNYLSRIKTLYLSPRTTPLIFSRLLQVSRTYYNHELFKYTFLKTVPFLYCITQITSETLSIISETLNFIVVEFNTTARLVIGRDGDMLELGEKWFGAEIEQYEKEQSNQDERGNKRYMVLRRHRRRLHALQKMYKYVLKFLTEHLHVFVAQGIPLKTFTNIFNINFHIETQILEFLPLQSICYCLTSHLELVNLMKSSVEKGQNFYDETFIDIFYSRTLKMGLLNFQKKKTYYNEELLYGSRNIKSLKTKIHFFTQICDYLRNDDFHRFRKKKLPKRDEIFQKNSQNDLLSILNYNNVRRLQQRELSYAEEMVSASGQAGMNQRLDRMGEIDFDVTILRYSLLYLISEQIDRTKAYSFMELNQIQNPYSLAGKKNFINCQQILKLYEELGEKSTVLIFTFVKVFGKRIDTPERIIDKLKHVITHKPDYGFPELLDLYIDHNQNSKNLLKRINYWKPPNIPLILKYLQPKYQPYLQLYVTKVLSRLRPSQILFYLPQIFQALALPDEGSEIIYNFLLQYAKKSASFAHQLIWIAKVQSKIEKQPNNKKPKLEGVEKNMEKLQFMANRIINDTIRQFTRDQKSFFREVDDFYEEVTAVSGKLRPQWPSSEKKQKIQEELKKIIVPHSVYLPTNPLFQVINLKIQSGTPMQSAAKCPFLLTFNCKKYIGPDKDFQQRKQQKHRSRFFEESELQPIKIEEEPHPIPNLGGKIFGSRAGRVNCGGNQSLSSESISQEMVKIEIGEIKVNISQSERKQRRSMYLSRPNHQKNNDVEVSCIFKVHDDIRQDSLALQIIQLFLEIFEKHDLQLKLFPYKTISNRTGINLDIGGIIEVVPKTVSRDSIGKTNEQSLYEFFINNFGPQYNINFQEARQNFIKSQAAYSIVSYILQIKDRHNGNILINKDEGFLVHIDFGFIFDISPANNLRFERADFKLTEQMIKIMGGKIDSQPFRFYMNLVIKGFLIVRKYQDHIQNLIKQMYKSGLPCFLERSLENLENRFVSHMNEIEAAEHMKKVIENAADHWTTNWYDRIQYIQQKIYH